MHHHPIPWRERPVSYFWSGDAIRSRSVSDTVIAGKLEIPEPPAWLQANWKRETVSDLALAPGDVEALTLTRARTRWPGFKLCVQAASAWTRTIGLRDVLINSDIALMAALGSRYHHDAEHYGGMAFCNLFLSEDRGLDLHFPATGRRIPLTRGTVVIFDTAQPHTVVERLGLGLHQGNRLTDQDRTQIFLTWELPIENGDVGHALCIDFDTDPATALGLDEEQVWLHGNRVSVCPASGAWHTMA